jgi:hypothetical protein
LLQQPWKANASLKPFFESAAGAAARAGTVLFAKPDASACRLIRATNLRPWPAPTTMTPPGILTKQAIPPNFIDPVWEPT